MKFDKRMKGVFVFLVLGLFVFSMMGVLGAPEDPDGDPSDYLSDGEFGERSGSGSTSDIGGTVSDEEFGSALRSFFDKGISFGQTHLKFSDAVEGVDEYKWILYAILLGMVIYSVLGSFFKQWYMKFGISVVITAIAMIGIPVELYRALEVNYGAMGSAILAVIPFIIILFFTLKVGSLSIARFIWVFFTFYMIFMSLARFINADDFTSGASWPYLLGIIAGLLMVFFMPLFRKAFFKEELKSQVEIAKHKMKVRQANREIEDEEAEGRGLGA